MSTNILIINLHSFRNAGDAALALSAIEQIRENFPDSQITLSLTDRDNYSGSEKIVDSFTSFFKPFLRDGNTYWNLWTFFVFGCASMLSALIYRINRCQIFFWSNSRQRALLKAYMQADLVASAPGNFLYSSGKGITLLLNLFTIIYGLTLSKPLYILPQSIGPFRKNWEKTIVTEVLKKARLVLVREPISLMNLKCYGIPHNRLHQVPDLAFSFKGAPVSETIDWLEENGISCHKDRPLLGITVINWGQQAKGFINQKKYETAISAAARYFVQELGGKVIIFPQVTGPSPQSDDRIPALRIHNMLIDLGPNVVTIEHPPTADLLKSAYGRMDIFIGTRMHSNIFAVSNGVPVLAIAYFHKTQGIMSLLSLSDWVVDINHIDNEILLTKLKQLWIEKYAVRQILEKNLPFVVQKSLKAGKLIADDFTDIYLERAE